MQNSYLTQSKPSVITSYSIHYTKLYEAFAVAAYTYVKYTVNKGQTPSVGLNSNISQALKDYVSEVYGKAIYYNNQYICAVYCASTGGRTLSSQYSWGKALPYLTSVESAHDSLV